MTITVKTNEGFSKEITANEIEAVSFSSGYVIIKIKNTAGKIYSLLSGVNIDWRKKCQKK